MGEVRARADDGAGRRRPDAELGPRALQHTDERRGLEAAEAVDHRLGQRGHAEAAYEGREGIAHYRSAFRIGMLRIKKKARSEENAAAALV